jgi:hypothetical protein
VDEDFQQRRLAQAQRAVIEAQERWIRLKVRVLDAVPCTLRVGPGSIERHYCPSPAQQKMITLIDEAIAQIVAEVLRALQERGPP